MDVLLRLRAPGLEARYWEDPITVRNSRRMDALGLLMGICINGYMCIAGAPQLVYFAAMSALFASLQLAQLCWMLLSPRSYHRWRVPVAWLQRLCWYISWLIALSFKRQVFDYAAVQHPQRSPAGSVRAALGLALHLPGASASSILNHPLPFRALLVLAVITFSGYRALGVPFQMDAVQPLQLEPLARRACMTISSVMLAMPMGQTHGPAQVCSEANSAQLVLSFCFTLVGLVLPLWIAYRQESCAKQAFLVRSGLAPAPQGGEPASGRGSLVMGLLFAWAWSALLWGLLVTLYPSCAASGEEAGAAAAGMCAAGKAALAAGQDLQRCALD